MTKQDYQHHKKYYAPHHFIFLPVMLIFTVVGLINARNETAERLPWLLFSLLSFCILYLAIMLRQHYALGNQNRIVRLEFRLRYLELFGRASESVEQQLSFDQIAALRFCGDEEFSTLLNRAVSEKLTGDAIKKEIKNWQADDMRV
jgi:hypothetical protein